MTGDQKTGDQRPGFGRQSDRPTGNREDSDDGSQQRNRNRRSSGGGGARRGAYRFDDQLEHDICQLVTHEAPHGFPVIARRDIATMPPVEVGRTETRILLCDGQHAGPHVWPNGDELVQSDQP